MRICSALFALLLAIAVTGCHPHHHHRYDPYDRRPPHKEHKEKVHHPGPRYEKRHDGYKGMPPGQMKKYKHGEGRRF